MTDDTIELIAAAMWREINGTTLSAKESRTMVSRYRKMARAALSAMPQQEVTVKDAAKVLLAVGQEATEVNRAFIIAANTRPAGAPQAIYEIELILEKAVKALRAISEGE